MGLLIRTTVYEEDCPKYIHVDFPVTELTPGESIKVPDDIREWIEGQALNNVLYEVRDYLNRYNGIPIVYFKLHFYFTSRRDAALFKLWFK